MEPGSEAGRNHHRVEESYMTKPLIHGVVLFVGGCPKTKCDQYVLASHVSAFRDEVTCPKCKKRMGKHWERKNGRASRFA